MRFGTVAVAAAGFAAAGLLSGCGGGETTAAPTPAPTPAPTHAPLTIDVVKLKAAAKDLLVKGTGTSKKTEPAWLDNVDNIDRALTVQFTVPGNSGFPGKLWTAAIDVGTCNRTWECAPLDFELCPGQALSTAHVRIFGETPEKWTGSLPGKAPQGFSKPTFSWMAKTGKFYSLIFVHLLSAEFAAMNPPLEAFFHTSYHNIPGNDVTKGVESARGWIPPGTPFGYSESYTLFLFEYDAKLPQQDMDAGAAIANNSTMPFDFKGYLATLKLTSSQLVSANWMKTVGSPVSFVNSIMAGFPIPDTVYQAQCAQLTSGKAAGATLDMCEAEIDRKCLSFKADLEEVV